MRECPKPGSPRLAGRCGAAPPSPDLPGAQLCPSAWDGGCCPPLCHRGRGQGLCTALAALGRADGTEGQLWRWGSPQAATPCAVISCRLQLNTGAGSGAGSSPGKGHAGAGGAARSSARRRATAGLGTPSTPVPHAGRSRSRGAPGCAGGAPGSAEPQGAQSNLGGPARVCWDGGLVATADPWLPALPAWAHPGKAFRHGGSVGKAAPAGKAPESPRSPGGALNRGCQPSVPHPAAQRPGARAGLGAGGH